MSFSRLRLRYGAEVADEAEDGADDLGHDAARATAVADASRSASSLLLADSARSLFMREDASRGGAAFISAVIAAALITCHALYIAEISVPHRRIIELLRQRKHLRVV